MWPGLIISCDEKPLLKVFTCTTRSCYDLVISIVHFLSFCDLGTSLPTKMIIIKKRERTRKKTCMYFQYTYCIALGYEEKSFMYLCILRSIYLRYMFLLLALVIYEEITSDRLLSLSVVHGSVLLICLWSMLARAIWMSKNSHMCFLPSVWNQHYPFWRGFFSGGVGVGGLDVDSFTPVIKEARPLITFYQIYTPQPKK